MESNQEKIFEAVYLGNLEDARRMLLCNPHLVSSQDGNGNQPMHIAVLQNNIDMVKVLVEFDAPIAEEITMDSPSKELLECLIVET